MATNSWHLVARHLPGRPENSIKSVPPLLLLSVLAVSVDDQRARNRFNSTYIQRKKSELEHQRALASWHAAQSTLASMAQSQPYPLASTATAAPVPAVAPDHGQPWMPNVSGPVLGGEVESKRVKEEDDHQQMHLPQRASDEEATYMPDTPVVAFSEPPRVLGASQTTDTPSHQHDWTPALTSEPYYHHVSTDSTPSQFQSPGWLPHAFAPGPPSAYTYLPSTVPAFRDAYPVWYHPHLHYPPLVPLPHSYPPPPSSSSSGGSTTLATPPSTGTSSPGWANHVDGGGRGSLVSPAVGSARVCATGGPWTAWPAPHQIGGLDGARGAGFGVSEERLATGGEAGEVEGRLGMGRAVVA